ncbi:hypothetical protein [Caulobacter sp. 17J65-9]|uniref:hypothetical protein n=1 Tax=Caulobacter sp. 17J65-9 TaxID=2709382 RepID=UPI0013C9D490|nr:hypothetical protein [Caulobacter sp. 17J65-9]NEX94699.1 hypothetical protein [Caulobacter sp. 17J65-9]
MARWADALTWWLAGWKPGPRPVIGAVIALLLTGVMAAFWIWLPVLWGQWVILQVIGDLLERWGLRPGWRVTLYMLCLVGAVGQALIATTDLFTPGLVRLRCGVRALADMASALFAPAIALGFGLNPTHVLEPGFQLGAWIAAGLFAAGALQLIRALANLRQALRPQPLEAAPAAA